MFYNNYFFFKTEDIDALLTGILAKLEEFCQVIENVRSVFIHLYFFLLAYAKPLSHIWGSEAPCE